MNHFFNFAFRSGSLAIPIAILCLLFYGGCGFDTRVVGGGSEAGNAIVVGRVLDDQGVPVGGVSVQAYGEDYDPIRDKGKPPCNPVVSDSKGIYRLHCQDSVRIRILGRHSGKHTSFLRNGIRPLVVKEYQDSDVILHVPGRLLIHLPESGTAKGGHIYIPGTPFVATIDSVAVQVGFVAIDSVPSGSLEAVRAFSPGANTFQSIATNVKLNPAEMVSISPYVFWNFSQTLRLNLSGIGGGIGQNLLAYPMLLRLNSGNFDFTKARSDGGDIRFAMPDGTPLAFEIEFWNATSAEAAVWVRLDTIFADNRAQSFKLYWGNSRAGARLPGLPVFDTATYFSGVWHLSESADFSSNYGIYRDATPGGTAGDDYITSRTQENFIGKALNITGRMWVEIKTPLPRMEPVNALTFSTWVKMDSIGDSGSVIASSAGGGYRLTLLRDSTIQFSIWDGQNWLATRSLPVPIRDSVWHYISAVFDGSNLRIAVDGQAGTSLPTAGRIQYFGLDRRFCIGNLAAYTTAYDYLGGIDEVQVSGIARSTGWNALNYASQKNASTVLSWVPEVASPSVTK